MVSSVDHYKQKIALLQTQIRERDNDVHKAATFGKQLLEDMNILNEKLEQLRSENESLKQDKYALQLSLEAQLQTANSQSSELEFERDLYTQLMQKCEKLLKESNTQKQQINILTHEKYDLEKNHDEASNENAALKNKIILQEQRIQQLQHNAELSTTRTSEVDLDVQNDTEYYKLKNQELEEALSEAQHEIKYVKLEENRLSQVLKELHEGISERDKEIKEYSIKMQKSREEMEELQGQIEVLKLEQLDENRRGNSVFSELDDRRKLVEKEYKLLANKCQSILKNYESNKQELSKCKGQMSILLSMTSRTYQDAYIKKLEDNLSESKREIQNVVAKLDKLTKCQPQPVTVEKLPRKTDEYGYLRVMLKQAESKVKELQNEVINLHRQNMNNNDGLARSQQFLYHTQEELNAVKLENQKLKQKIKDGCDKPDLKTPDENKPKIEILPFCKTGTAEKEIKKEAELDKSNLNDTIIPGELFMDDDGFREVRRPRKSNKFVLQSLNLNDSPKIETFSSKSKVFSKSVVESRSDLEERVQATYEKCKSDRSRRANDGKCAQQ